MKATHLALAAGLATALPTHADAPLPLGAWRTDGYGYVLANNGEKLQIFDETKTSCLLNDTVEGREIEDWIGKVALARDGIHALLQQRTSRTAVSKLPTLPAVCKPWAEDQDPLRNFDHLWTTFDEHYAFFKERNVDWKALRAKYRPQAAAAKSPQQLFAIVSAMLAHLRDAHVSLTAGDATFKVEREAAPAFTRKALQIALKDYVSGPTTPLLKPARPIAGNRVWFGELPGKIGYIVVFAMGGFEEDDVTASDHAESAHGVFQEIAGDFRDVQGVVVDLRGNQGGYDAVSLDLVSLFASRPGIAFRKRAHGATAPAYSIPLVPAQPRRLNKPVAVLIGEHTVSAGETAAAVFHTLPNATLIGQPTQGALSDVLEKKLPNGWTFTLSNEIFQMPDGTIPEVRGVAPHITTTVAKASSSLAERFKPDIDEAIRALKRKSQPPR